MKEVVIELSVLSVLDILSIATAFMLGLLFLTTKSKNNKANIFLGLFLWSLVTEVSQSFIDGQEIDNVNTFTTASLTLPLLFLYIIKTLNYKFKFIYLVLLIPFIWDVLGFSSEIIGYVFSFLILIYALDILKKHKVKLGDFYSDVENKTFSWVKTIIYIFLFFNVFWVIEDLVGIQNESLIEYFAITSNVLTFFMIYWIGYNGFSQPEMFTSPLSLFNKKEAISVKSVEETKNQFLEITHTVQQQKLFSKTDLNLRSLSTELCIKEKELSKLINQHTKNNFYHFINQFRIEEFKKLLESPKSKQLSLLGLAEEAGFSSKSTFYTAFKNAEGITPKQYQNQLKKSE
ncbi:helix-turn-helix transcriptional regulator [Tenacibaculum sp. S7007]|uniref:Helix-turn-helix transcriptional regulator n=1 Tax=Tenacibaculum pelagium TaxID=2759527 RepID=A0A839ARI3_9FLAO|nr:helix-turn-helix domain-containing protein [Tenacibaculum pelagium]MBA6156261.1 helix-turn-helix transcriptional regulator [Tenacibaculum pelagium]